MDEKPEGTPNPLNPNLEKGPEPDSEMLDANPSEPLEPVENAPEVAAETKAANEEPKKMPVLNMPPAVSAMPDIKPAPKTTVPTRPNVISDFGGGQNNASAKSAGSANAAPQTANPTGPVINATAQAAQPVTTAKKPKKKAALIIGLILLLLALIGGIVAAMMLKDMNKGDPVALATQKIMDGQMPENIKIGGTIEITPNDENALVSDLKIEVNSDMITSSLINASQAKLTATLKDDSQISVDLDEVYAANNDLYLKLDNITEALEEYTAIMNQNGATGALEDCTTAETGETTCTQTVTTETDCEEGVDCAVVETTEVTDNTLTESIAGLLGLAEVVDGTWLKIPTDEMGEFSEELTDSMAATCLATLANDIRNNGNLISNAYNKNPFIASTTQDVTLASKGNGAVYKVLVDEKNWNSFSAALKGSSVENSLNSCADALLGTSDLPDFYVEVDENYDFTRLYFENQMDDTECICDDPNDCPCDDEPAGYSVKVDLDFSYPKNVNVAEPVEYTNFSELIQTISTEQYALPGTEEGVAQ